MSCYLVGIGGSGARCVEAALYLCAAGLGPDRLTLVFVDPDQSNASWARVGELAAWYQTLQEVPMGEQCGLFQTEIELPLGRQPWSPLQARSQNPPPHTLDEYFNAAGMPESTRAVYEALYTPNQRNLKLHIGFQGQPSIGAAIFADALNASLAPGGS